MTGPEERAPFSGLSLQSIADADCRFTNRCHTKRDCGAEASGFPTVVAYTSSALLFSMTSGHKKRLSTWVILSARPLPTTSESTLPKIYHSSLETTFDIAFDTFTSSQEKWRLESISYCLLWDLPPIPILTLNRC